MAGCEEPTTYGWRTDDDADRQPQECVTHRTERAERERQARARSAAIRRPPKPATWDAPGCRMCGTTDLPPRRRSWCSDACVDLWQIASTPAFAAAHLAKLHGPACWGCGATDQRTELEHVRPLWSLTDEERTELRWWLPFNLQLLCVPCHRTKSAAEAGQRAALRRV